MNFYQYSCVRSVLLYGSQSWPLSVKIEQKQSAEELRRIYVHHIADVLIWNRLRLSGHLFRQEETSWTNKIMSFNVDGPTYRGRPKLNWEDVVNTDLHKKHQNISLASDGSNG